MASALATQKFLAENKVEMWDHDPGTTNALIASPDGGTTKRMVDMLDYGRFVAGAQISVLAAGALTKIEIVASDDAAGATHLTVVKDSGVIAADAEGDWAVLECTAEEIRQLSDAAGYALRYVGLRLTMSNAGAEAVVLYVRTESRFKHLDKTPATTIA